MQSVVFRVSGIVGMDFRMDDSKNGNDRIAFVIEKPYAMRYNGFDC